jgi:hypothetical protein
MRDLEIMKERPSFRENLKIRESGRSGNRRRSGRARKPGRVAIGGGAKGPRGREAESSLHQYQKNAGLIGLDRYL